MMRSPLTPPKITMLRGQPLSPVLSFVAQTGHFVTREMKFFSYYGDWCTTATPVKSSYTPVSKKPIMLRMINAKALSTLRNSLPVYSYSSKTTSLCGVNFLFICFFLFFVFFYLLFKRFSFLLPFLIIDFIHYKIYS